MTQLSFETSITTDDSTGNLLAVYFQIRKGKVHQTCEFADGAAFADYNQHGELIGIELIGPCKVSIVDQLAANEPLKVRRETKRYIRQAGPRGMVAV